VKELQANRLRDHNRFNGDHERFNSLTQYGMISRHGSIGSKGGMLTRRRDVRRYYRHLRAICTQHHTAVIPFISQAAFLEQAKRIRLTTEGALITNSTEALTLVYDLATYAAKPGRSRAIDRYARTTHLPHESDEMRVLEAMCRGQFSIWRIEHRHHIYGLVATDLLRKDEIWLIDEAMTASVRNGVRFAGRLCHLEHFTITNGVAVPVVGASMEQAIADAIARGSKDPNHASETANFAADIYRAALEDGASDRVLFR
jgi:hypothetical protein